MPRLLVERLRDLRHDVAWAVGDAAGEIDERVLAQSVAQNRVLISRDHDFGDLIFVRRCPAIGVLLVSLGAGARKEMLTERALEAVVTFGDQLRGRFTTIGPDRTRQRDLPSLADRT